MQEERKGKKRKNDDQSDLVWENNCRSQKLIASWKVHCGSHLFAASTLYILSHGEWVVSEIKVILSRTTDVHNDLLASGRLVSSVTWRRLGSVSAAPKKEDEKTRWEEQGKKKYVIVIRQAGNAFIALAVMANCHSTCPFLASYYPSCLSSQPHDGQLDLTCPLRHGGCV